MASSAPDVVLVGLCDGELDTNRYRSTFVTNKVGGTPDVPPQVSRPCPRCSRCGAALFHVVQVYCPLEASPYHRTLNLFACHEEDCSGRSESWRVLRSQSLEADTLIHPTPPHEPSLSATDWCESADDWGMDEGQGDDRRGGNMKQQTQDKTTPNGTQGKSLSFLLNTLPIGDKSLYNEGYIGQAIVLSPNKMILHGLLILYISLNQQSSLKLFLHKE